MRSNTDRRVSRQILSPPIPYGSSLSIHIADLTNIVYQFEMRIRGECVSVRNADQWGMRISLKCGSVGNAYQFELQNRSKNADQLGGNAYQSGMWIRALSMNSTFGAPPPPTGNDNLTEFFSGKSMEKKGKNILYSIFLKY